MPLEEARRTYAAVLCHATVRIPPPSPEMCELVHMAKKQPSPALNLQVDDLW